MSRDVVALVPSIGRSPHAAAALAALRSEMGGGEIVWIAPRGAPPPSPLGPDERWLELDRELGFAAAVNRGVAASSCGTIAVVNDDAVVEPGWLGALQTAMGDDPRVAAAQGVIVELGDERLVDGRGIGWNRWWQAIQLDRGEPTPDRSAPVVTPFGAQATAAIFRRAALEAVSESRARPFDERLGTWYEDVDLALRLHAAGFEARSTPVARVRHAGSTSGATRPWRRRRLLARNRLLVVARMLGWRFAVELPRIAARDLLDAVRAAARGDLVTASAIAAGWVSAIPAARSFARLGTPLLTMDDLERFSATSR